MRGSITGYQNKLCRKSTGHLDLQPTQMMPSQSQNRLRKVFQTTIENFQLYKRVSKIYSKKSAADLLPKKVVKLILQGSYEEHCPSKTQYRMHTVLIRYSNSLREIVNRKHFSRSTVKNQYQTTEMANVSLSHILSFSFLHN